MREANFIVDTTNLSTIMSNPFNLPLKYLNSKLRYIQINCQILADTTKKLITTWHWKNFILGSQLVLVAKFRNPKIGNHQQRILPRPRALQLTPPKIVAHPKIMQVPTAARSPKSCLPEKLSRTGKGSQARQAPEKFHRGSRKLLNY